MNRQKLKILLADDHAIVRSGIRRLLRDEPDIDTVEEADTASAALLMVRKGDWDVVVMDINMPGQSALDVLRLMKLEKPGLPVIILTMHSEEQFAVRMLKAGAAGYVTKASAADYLLAAIRKVAQGGAYVSATLAAHLAARLKTQPKASLDDLLSDREFSVMCAIAEGKPLSQIASELHLSAKTITTYRARVMSKLDMHSNSELVRFALDHGLIE